MLGEYSDDGSLDEELLHLYLSQLPEEEFQSPIFTGVVNKHAIYGLFMPRERRRLVCELGERAALSLMIEAVGGMFRRKIEEKKLS